MGLVNMAAPLLERLPGRAPDVRQRTKWSTSRVRPCHMVCKASDGDPPYAGTPYYLRSVRTQMTQFILHLIGRDSADALGWLIHGSNPPIRFGT